MQVKLLAYTPEPELTAAAAARLCYSQVSATDILEKLDQATVSHLIKLVVESGHLSTVEHISFTFAIDGLSRAASHQLVRHRLASYSQQSQRWVSLKEPEYVTPPVIAGNAELKKAFEGAVTGIWELYRQMLAQGVPPEDARYVLPNATETNLIMTVNARELIHICSLRLCTRAQWEIRRLFQLIKSEVTTVAPLIADYLEPKCIQLGYCDERETCGIRPLKAEVVGLG